MLSEMNRIEKDKYCMILLTQKIHHIHRNSRSVVCRGGELGGDDGGRAQTFS